MPNRRTNKRRMGGRRRRMNGGDGAAENALNIVGNGNQQWDNVFKGSGNTSNALVPMNKAGGSRRRKRGGVLGEVINTALVPATILAMQNTYGRKRRGGGTTSTTTTTTMPPSGSMPTMTTMPPAGGSRRRRGKKGGLWGEVINRGVVPFGILAMQQTYGRRRKQGGTKRRRR